MISGLMLRAAELLAKKSVVFSFGASAYSEQLRKFYASFPAIARAAGVSVPSLGRALDEDAALKISTVWACNRVISETVASLPLHLMAHTSDGKVPADGLDGRPLHPLYAILHDAPNEEMSDDTFRETLTSHCALWGGAYALKVRRTTGETIGLWPWKPTETRPDRSKRGALVFVHKDGGAAEKTFEPGDVFHVPGLGFDGVKGYSVIGYAAKSLGIAYVQDEYVSSFFAQGGRRPYYLRKPSKFKSDDAYNEWRKKWDEAYTTANGFYRAPVIEGDMEYHELGMPLGDAQLLESRQFTVPDICRWWRVSPHLVGDLSRATFANIEHLALEFVQQTLLRWLVRWEKAINRQLLTEAERPKFFAKHNVNALLRGDFASRMAGYATALQNGIYSINEVRDLEDLNPFEGGDEHHIQLNMQSLPADGGADPQAGAATASRGSSAALVRVGASRRAARRQ